MQVFRTPQAYTEALANWPEDASFALVIVDTVDAHIQSTVREAARLCDVVVGASLGPIRESEVLAKAGMDALIVLPEAIQPVRMLTQQSVDVTPIVQAVNTVFPSILLLNATQQRWLEAVTDLLATVPLLVTPRLWVTPSDHLPALSAHWHRVVKGLPLTSVRSVGGLAKAFAKALENQQEVRGVGGLVPLNSRGLVTDELKKVRWISLRLHLQNEDVVVVAPWPLQQVKL